MKCPECVKEGLRSRVSFGATSTTLMGVSRYYDEDGKLVVHDPNTRTTRYNCSEGHVWIVRERS